MKLLLDTHAALWILTDDERLSDNVWRHITDSSNLVLLSAASVWEIAIKRALGKLAAPDECLALLLDTGVTALSVSAEHAASVEQLPAHHRDPFDRILIAQAIAEGAALVSCDPKLRPYGVTLVW